MGIGDSFCCSPNPLTNTVSKKIKDEDEYYLKLKKIGSGAYGEAFLIISEKTKINYIAKIIKIKNPNSKNMKTAFEEVSILQQCHHPNIILFKEVFKQRLNKELTFNIITEYCDDGDLNMKSKEKIDKGEHFEETQLISWLMQVCLALEYLHNKKIIHRDIKPSNIFLTKKGYVKLGDFGFSKIFDNLEENMENNKNKNENEYNPDIKKLKRMQSLKGTPSFLAPEVLVFHKYNEKTDIWALGITFYYLMNFTCPYQGNSFFNLCSKIALDYREEKSYNCLYSQEFVNLIESMIYRNPEDRPTAKMILNSKVIRDRMAPFLNDHNFDCEAVSKYIKQYEKEHKNAFEEKMKKIEKEIIEKKDIISDPIVNISLSKEDIQMQKQNKENKEEYEMNKLLSLVNKVFKE